MIKLIAVGALLVAACGGDDDGPSVAELCFQTANDLCERLAVCGVEGGSLADTDRPAAMAECKSGFLRSLDCSRQTRIEGSPDVCRAELNATPCHILNEATPETFAAALPASCKGIYFSQ